ncbi:MAG: peptidylprolyl isomerase [Pirellulales bacterium]
MSGRLQPSTISERGRPAAPICLSAAICLAVWMGAAWTARAAEDDQAAGRLDPQTVVATVAGVTAQPAPPTKTGAAARLEAEPIVAGEVYQVLAEALRGRAVNSDDPAVVAHALEQVINRRLVAAHLVETGYGAGPEEVDALWAELLERLAAGDVTVEAFLKERGTSESALRRQLAWNVAWHRYLEGQLTDEALQRHFDAHRRHFDGTELRVSHILLKVEESAGKSSGKDRSAVVREAEQLRGDILAGKLTFAEAAERHSAGPSRRQGGDLGFIPRRARMVEAFSRAAFALEKGEISPPVTTQFGIHLIQCTDVKPGTLTWQDVRGDLAAAVARELFADLARPLRAKAKVEYSGAMPHLGEGNEGGKRKAEGGRQKAE